MDPMNKSGKYYFKLIFSWICGVEHQDDNQNETNDTVTMPPLATENLFWKRFCNLNGVIILGFCAFLWAFFADYRIDKIEIDKISESCRNEFQNVSTLITNFKHQRVEPARDKLKQRYEDSETAKGAVSTVGGVVGIAGSATAGGLLASPILGVAGLIIVGSVTVTAPLVIPVAVVVGLIGIGALGYGIWKFMKKYGNHQTLAMKSLECLAKLCDKMKSEATKMIEHSNHLLKNTDNLCSKLKKLTYSLKSEQQRRMHAEACGQIKNANQTLAKTLKTIIDFEMTSCSELGDTLLSSNQHAITSSD
ncbi:unnamed protein product [Rotaria magnacalcarata]|uniref:Uncharacterized protein n=2 Tax=Rotaria magnacalcarata TaxID=392030 RepID=A0A816NRS7_9BILA|nr:unnamed protein product [Rotaria magnacalcarata]CAF1550791.1 unnamed protein product [Rotaria magnacalcarata]CAF1912357.1 unnamed protein product [Rotaria magnacalcarata]CAF2038499.1 unnamed protein product [Rotaria magnacalcarata]CAF2158923.1 unnamed protein product [Rotaria magnacalcarata]